MAFRGRKPKPTHLHVVQGTFRKDRHERKGEPKPEGGGPPKPPKLKGRASTIWDEIIARCTWLSWADGPKAHVFCCLMAEFEKAPTKMVSAKITQIRTLGSELGLDPASRARIGGGDGGKEDDDPASKYF